MYTLNRQSLLNVDLLVSESLSEKTLQSFIKKPNADEKKDEKGEFRRSYVSTN